MHPDQPGLDGPDSFDAPGKHLRQRLLRAGFDQFDGGKLRIQHAPMRRAKLRLLNQAAFDTQARHPLHCQRHTGSRRASNPI